MRKRIALLLCLLLPAMALQGCWNYKEVDAMLIVAGVAVDRGTDGHKYRLTFDIADTSSASKDKPVATEILESEGDSLLDAIRSADERAGMRLYFENCQTVVIGRDVAEDSILPIIDFVMRNNEFRTTTGMFISAEKTAGDILKAKAATMSIISFEIDKIYEQNERLEPVAVYRVAYQNYNTMASKGRALTLASIRLKQSNGEKTPVLDGMAVFKGDRLAGFLSAEDSKYAMFAMDAVKGGVLNVTSPAGNPIAALEIRGCKTSVTPVVENGSVRFHVYADVVATAEENAGSMPYLDQEHRAGFEAAAEGQLEKEIQRAVAVVKDLGLDIFGFGEALHKSDPGAWYALEKDWNEVFRALNVDVTCRISVRNSASKIQPARVGDQP